MLEAFSFRNADTSSRSSVCTLSLEPFSRRTWNVFGPEPDVRSRSPTRCATRSWRPRGWHAPALVLAKAAVRSGGIGETFASNPIIGTASLTGPSARVVAGLKCIASAVISFTTADVDDPWRI